MVDKDYFDLFIDALDRLENGDSVYSEDYFQEYNSFNGKYYLNKEDKMIYELIGNNLKNCTKKSIVFQNRRDKMIV